MSWILTISARKFDLLNPTAAMVRTSDIVHALSLVCRFTGHCAYHYSVAQHSLLVASILEREGCSPEEQLVGLLHDASEAYVNDLTRPLKLLLVEAARQRNELWQSILAEHCPGQENQGIALKAAIRHLLPNEQGQGLSALIDIYQQIEGRVWFAICEHFAIDPDLPASVKRADMVALATEKRDLLPENSEPWQCLEGLEPMPFRVARTDYEEVRIMFHRRLLELLSTTHRGRAVA
ncbi:hypothetical protein [Aquipseudomonas alcaligenes]|uniref:Phosphohydrolase n=1 Tax=Aquipseudomonas alcaligenes TaxID=43263 RepID=A0A1N6SAF9_AQUAC|nr:hypothetical protein [Pseudomonas alcaligenes]SIQ38049.1 hypothetical protein SAMN05878282_103441 [Pseudomonas alcaligenes]